MAKLQMNEANFVEKLYHVFNTTSSYVSIIFKLSLSIGTEYVDAD